MADPMVVTEPESAPVPTPPVPLARAQEAELLRHLRAAREEPGLWSLRQLLQLRLARLDRQLRRCLPAEFAALQAQAYLCEKLLEDIFLNPT
jgi:hypothetical protein